MSIDDIRDRMGDATRKEAESMRAVVIANGYGDTPTIDIPESKWLDMIYLATQPTHDELVRDAGE